MFKFPLECMCCRPGPPPGGTPGSAPPVIIRVDMAAMLARTMFPGLVSLYEILDSGSRGGGHTLERKPAGGYERCALYNLLTEDKYAYVDQGRYCEKYSRP